MVYSVRPSDRVITYISENVTSLLGYDPAFFTEDHEFWQNHIHPEDIERIAALKELPENLDTSVTEFRFLKLDGTYCWLRGERKLIRDQEGTPIEHVGSLSDITERKNNEEILRQSEAKYRALYEDMMDAYVSVEMDGRIKQFNQAYLDMVGYEPDELRNLSFHDLTPEKWHAYEAEITNTQVIGRGYSDVYEKEYIRKDGTVFPVELRAALLKDDKGNPTGMWALIRDTSERKLFEQNLRESETRYRELQENSLQGVFVFQDGRIIYSNQAVTESFGYTSEELTSFSEAEILQFIYPDDRTAVKKRLERHPEEVGASDSYSLRIFHKNGELHRLEVRSVQINFQGKPAVMTTTIDVSEIKKVEAELRESEMIQRTIVNASDAMVFMVDTNGRILSSNEKFINHMHLNAETVVGASIYAIIPKSVAETRIAHFTLVFMTGKPVTFVDSREGIWFENSFYPILDDNGKVAHIVVFIRDITENRRVTEALRASEEQYRQLAEAAPDLIFIINEEGVIQYVNSFGAQFLGKAPRELVGQPRRQFFPSETNDHQESSIRRVFQTGESISAESAHVFLKKTVWLNTWLVPLKNRDGKVVSVLGVSRDITGRKLDEMALQEARDRLEERVAERTNDLEASQKKLRILAAQTIATQEKERRAISRELHDEAGQALITLQYSLAAIQSELPEQEKLARQRLDNSLKIIDQTVQHIRELAHSLRPPVMEIGGIDLSLREYCREQSERTKIPIQYQGEEVPGLPDEIAISLYRFVQEALTNILKYASATKVKVNLAYTRKKITLMVSDNGLGMEYPIPTDGLGLLGIKERLALLDGRLEIHSQKARGTRLVAQVPWVGSASHKLTAEKPDRIIKRK